MTFVLTKDKCYLTKIEQSFKITDDSYAKLDPFGGEPVKKVVSGVNTVFVLTSRTCYVIGSNDNYQAGVLRKKSKICTFTELKIYDLDQKQEKIVEIATHKSHTAIITASNRCYLFGLNKEGQLGFKSKKRKVFHPTQLNIPGYVTSVACGRFHTVVLTETNRCFGFGSNYSGQLNASAPATIFQFIEINPAELLADKSDHIAFIACGNSYTILLSSYGLGYAFGSNAYNQLGLSPQVYKLQRADNKFINAGLITIINDKLEAELINYVTCGSAHTVVLTKSKKCYVFGINHCSQLGIGHYKYCVDTPTLLPSSIEIKTVGCRINATTIVTVDGDCAHYGSLEDIFNIDHLNFVSSKFYNRDEIPDLFKSITGCMNQMQKPYNWKAIRLLWIAYYKNKDNPECLIGRLPIDMIKLIVIA